MKFSSTVLFAMAAGLVAAQSTPSPTTSAPIPSHTPTVIEQCVARCPAGDVRCQADCVGNPRPDEGQVNRTTECAAKCVQGDGTLEQTERYAACQQECIRKEFFPISATNGGAAPTGANRATGSNAPTGSGTGSRAPTGTGSSATPSGSNSAGSGASKAAAPVIGFFAFVAAAVAL